jgi:hypothetical protein
MTFMTPDAYERVQATNAWTGRSDLVGLRHIDEFNQTAGRNLGYRKSGDVRHVLLVNRRLFGLLTGGESLCGEAGTTSGSIWTGTSATRSSGRGKTPPQNPHAGRTPYIPLTNRTCVRDFPHHTLA